MKIIHDLLTGEYTSESVLIDTIPSIIYEDRDGIDYFIRKISDGIIQQVILAGFYHEQRDVSVFKKPNNDLVEYWAKLTGDHFEIYETPCRKDLEDLVMERPEYRIDVAWGRGVWNGVNEVRNHLRLIGAEITNHPWEKMPYFTYEYLGEVVCHKGHGIVGQIPASLDTSKLPGIY